MKQWQISVGRLWMVSIGGSPEWSPISKTFSAKTRWTGEPFAASSKSKGFHQFAQSWSLNAQRTYTWHQNQNLVTRKLQKLAQTFCKTTPALKAEFRNNCLECTSADVSCHPLSSTVKHCQQKIFENIVILYLLRFGISLATSDLKGYHGILNIPTKLWITQIVKTWKNVKSANLGPIIGLVDLSSSSKTISAAIH